jgi:hypothetical protein
MPVRMEKDDDFQEDNTSFDNTNLDDNNSYHINYSYSSSSRNSSWVWSLVFNLIVQVVRTLLFRRRR